MLKIFGKKSKKKTVSGSNRQVDYASRGMPIDKVVEVMQAMPIGRKVEYCPEFKREVVLETVIIGFVLNGLQLFSSKKIRHIEEQGEHQLLIETKEKEVRISSVESFCFIVPFNPDDEHKIDYTHRAEIGKRGIFAKNNSLALSIKEQGGLVRTLDTTVIKTTPVKEGVYANYQVVWLDVMPSTLVSSDRRRHYRIRTRVPCALVVKDEIGYPCMMVDYSGESIRLHFEGPEKRSIAALRKGQVVTVDVMLAREEQSRHYALSGYVYDSDDESVVLILQGVIKEGQTTGFSIIDRLDLKANLLEHPDTISEE